MDSSDTVNQHAKDLDPPPEDEVAVAKKLAWAIVEHGDNPYFAENLTRRSS